MLAATVIVGACGGSPQAHSITVTFVRHAESETNASGVIDTDVPGPGLTPEGKGQAEQVAHQLAHNKYDAVYASTMVRTQQTAAPLAAELGKQVEVLQGIQEINAGWYEGKPVSMAPSTYRRTGSTATSETASPGRSPARSSTTGSPRPCRRSTTAATTNRWCSRICTPSSTGR
ncbi:hypothetical protein MINTM008_09600 [Mycobacterium intracellulare]|uniref:Histidine phosphatase super family protein n=2 Tax=Mycobacterium TaxID=1763 RepID=A0AAI8SK34_MYCAV|nr:histidine phosphatase super family protein [Mycobacterium intracellulare MIN_061107_1834]ETZ40401.1 histidine phosphatase super family protein [Mycobacterium intracellulare MIN_052511_1280]ETZ41520.1 histidine phosphatase super family protein [Mycobacterium avium MAV_120809_2495]ETZ69092.1 histidine phosphatase super family protein [Mycobacterium sp. MAC_011194_8550]BBN46467.1 hypothetical protein JPH1_09420 [Mycobacterium avium subsp. hominissuis]BCO45031.1 hypothetical protein MINTM002_07